MSDDRVWPFGKPESEPVKDVVVSKKSRKKVDETKEGDADGTAQE